MSTSRHFYSTKRIKVHPVGNMNVCTIFHDNPSNRCSDVSVKGEVRGSDKLFGIILSGPRMSAEISACPSIRCCSDWHSHPYSQGDCCSVQICTTVNAALWKCVRIRFQLTRWQFFVVILQTCCVQCCQEIPCHSTNFMSFPPVDILLMLCHVHVVNRCKFLLFMTTTSVVLSLRPVRRHCHHRPLEMSNIRVPVDVLHLTFRPLPCLQVSGSTAGSLASSSSPSTSSRQYTRQRITRVNLRDLIFYMEQERETAHSLLLYRALLK